jgi:hypothetical protein
VGVCMCEGEFWGVEMRFFRLAWKLRWARCSGIASRRYLQADFS